MAKTKRTRTVKPKDEKITEPAVGDVDIQSAIDDIPGKPEKLTWLNGGGSFRMGGNKPRIIKPNQRFKAYVEEIPEAFRNVIKPVDPEKLAEAIKESAIISETSFSIQEAGDDMYNIVTSTGKQMNTQPMSLEKAQDTIEALT